MKLVDTSVAVDHLRGTGAATAVLVGALESGEALVASEVVRFELLAGVRPGEVDGLEALMAALVWLPVTEEVAREAGALARRFRSSHGGIDDADYLIAATALLVGADLLTRNVRHFPMFDGLEAPY